MSLEELHGKIWVQEEDFHGQLYLLPLFSETSPT